MFCCANIYRLHNPRAAPINKTHQRWVEFIGWGARIRTMIKRTKISCPTIRRHPKDIIDYTL